MKSRNHTTAGFVRMTRWVGLGLCVLLAGTAVASFQWALTRYATEFAGFRLLMVSDGAFEYHWWGSWGARDAEPSVRWAFRVHRDRHRLGIRELCWARFQHTGVERLVRVPLWLPLLVCAAATFMLWWIDRRTFPPGHCPSCGYNLTGNQSGVCPECGTGLVLVNRARPKRRRRVEGHHWLAWTLAVLGVGGGLTTTVVPLVVQCTVAISQDRGLLSPMSAGYLGACVVVDAVPAEWDWLGRPTRFVRHSTNFTCFSLSGGPVGGLRMVLDATARRFHDGLVLTIPIGDVNLQTVLERLARLGIDVESEAVRKEAAELLEVIRAVPEGREQEIACPSFGVSQTEVKRDMDLHPWAIPGAVVFWSAVWLMGILVLVRRRRRTVRGIEDRQPRVERF